MKFLLVAAALCVALTLAASESHVDAEYDNLNEKRGFPTPRPPTRPPTKRPSTPRPPTKKPTKRPSTPRPPTKKPTRKPSTPRPPTPRPTGRPTTPRPPTKKPTRRPSTPRPPTVKPTRRPSTPRPPTPRPTRAPTPPPTPFKCPEPCDQMSSFNRKPAKCRVYMEPHMKEFESWMMTHKSAKKAFKKESIKKKLHWKAEKSLRVALGWHVISKYTNDCADEPYEFKVLGYFCNEAEWKASRVTDIKKCPGINEPGAKVLFKRDGEMDEIVADEYELSYEERDELADAEGAEDAEENAAVDELFDNLSDERTADGVYEPMARESEAAEVSAVCKISVVLPDGAVLVIDHNGCMTHDCVATHWPWLKQKYGDALSLQTKKSIETRFKDTSLFVNHQPRPKWSKTKAGKYMHKYYPLGKNPEVKIELNDGWQQVEVRQSPCSVFETKGWCAYKLSGSEHKTEWDNEHSCPTPEPPATTTTMTYAPTTSTTTAKPCEEDDHRTARDICEWHLRNVFNGDCPECVAEVMQKFPLENCIFDVCVLNPTSNPTRPPRGKGCPGGVRGPNGKCSGNVLNREAEQNADSEVEAADLSIDEGDADEAVAAGEVAALHVQAFWDALDAGERVLCSKTDGMCPSATTTTTAAPVPTTTEAPKTTTTAATEPATTVAEAGCPGGVPRNAVTGLCPSLA